MKKSFLLYLPILAGVFIFLSLTYWWFTPRTNSLTAKAISADGRYEIHLRSVDYGGSFSECSITYEEGIGIMKYYFGKDCGGITLHQFLVKKGLINRYYELAKLPSNLSCGSEAGLCATTTVEELESFEVEDEQTIKWYGEEINYQ